MTEKVNRLYKGAKRNYEFIKAYQDADGDKVPNILSNHNLKVIFASIYYGWLIGKYGVDWEANIISKQ